MEEKSILVANVLNEIKLRTASAACDRRTNYLMEKLCFASNLENLVEILQRFSTYAVFLARNRYSSHVLQVIIMMLLMIWSDFLNFAPDFLFINAYIYTSLCIQALFARLCYILKFEGFGDCDEEVVKDTIVSFVQPILDEVSWLSSEISASHVLRSIICMLIGSPVVSEKKVTSITSLFTPLLCDWMFDLWCFDTLNGDLQQGKGSKHQHSVSLSEPLEQLLLPGRFCLSHTVCFGVPTQFHGKVFIIVTKTKFFFRKYKYLWTWY